MKVLEVKTLAIPEVKTVKFARFCDARGYFTEHFRKSDLTTLGEEIPAFRSFDFVQANESRSRAGVMRGLHFQWNPYMGKLVRTVAGHMVDMVLDIRKNSPMLGKIILFDMPNKPDADWNEWIWVPPGFAHGNFFPEDSIIEYFCTGEYSPGCEAGISPLASDLDWCLADAGLKRQFENIVRNNLMLSDKDRDGLDLQAWLADSRSENFIFGKC
jgi:dTDP-4-dehydrorhamnose 3,5-epimerase